MTSTDKLRIVQAWVQRDTDTEWAPEEPGEAVAARKSEPVGVAGRLLALSQDVRGAIETLLDAPSRLERDSAVVMQSLEGVEEATWANVPHLASRLRETLQTAIQGYLALAATLESWDLDGCDQADAMARAVARGLDAIENEIDEIKDVRPLVA